ncbi:hypothetical protein PA598K_00257 [Paenibacillus sp. 598K]|uniref:hypothetical protein n=1 Tax=Paenibacillus sp. 598K TaxID=1117987 RepID=UPI000FF95B42|nr:hypothetical protein [Paenibacillus sp. 598K]GBF72027.1 hypothetical protein PA598K_00257 [Paenibacillus sp. 598K]
MTYRSLDLQMSIPRTPEAGGIQSQMMNRPSLEQQQLASETTKTAEQLRHKSGEVGEAAETAIQDEQHGHPGGRDMKQNHSEAEQEEAKDAPPAPHPYKGKHIDISL